MRWYRHLPVEQSGRLSPLEWGREARVDIARALVDCPEDERVAYWAVNEASTLDAMAGRERAERDAMPEQGSLL